MLITDEAKVIVLKGLEANKCDCLKATLKKSGCGSSVSFSLANLSSDVQAETINDIPVIMDEETKKRIEQLTLYVENGELLFQDDAPSTCSSCSSCS